MGIRKTNAAINIDPAYLPVVRLCILLALLRCNGSSEFIEDDGFGDCRIARVLGLPERAPSRFTMQEASKLIRLGTRD